MELYDYTESYAGYFWQWEERGEVIAIPGGSTVAYREHIIEILDALKDSGAPPFGSLLLVLIALNPEPGAGIQFVNTILAPKPQKGTTLQDAGAFMRLLTHLPLQYKQGPGKTELLRALFKDGHNNVRVKMMRRIVEAFSTNSYTVDRLLLQKPYNDAICYKDLRVLALLHSKLKTVEDIQRRIAGLPDVELPDLELDEKDVDESEYADFVEELADNQKTFHVGSLIRRIWSGLNIPFHNVLPSEQPMGGVSDLTNKGDFHRLLVSEFANDDIVFLSRLANNEALYINREIPPQSNNIERVILIDVSIKNWGTPKAIAYALMLAIARHPKTDIRCSVFAVGEDYHPVDYETIDGIIAALPILEGCLHPGPGLRKFFSGYEDAKNMEVIFITNPETIHSSGLVMDLLDYQSFFKYWLIADHEGNIDVYKRQQKGKKHHQHLRLPLEELWKKPPTEKKQRSKGNQGNRDNPVPLGTLDYPILFPGCSSAKKIMTADDGTIFKIGRDKNVYRSNSGPAKSVWQAGWEMVYRQLPKLIDKFGLGRSEKNEYVLLGYSTAQKKLYLVNLNTGERKEVDFFFRHNHNLPEFFFQEGRFHVHGPGKLITITPGEEIQVERKEAWIDQEKSELYAERQKVLNSNNGLLHQGPGFLKNINKVYISAAGNLALNNHELILGAHGVRWITTGHSKSIASANHLVLHEWTFPEGSKVRTTESGMIILERQSSPGKQVFIPTVIDQPLGMATAVEFCGNDYYLPEHNSLRQIKPEDFWRQHVTDFIDTIKNHAANH